MIPTWLGEDPLPVILWGLLLTAIEGALWFMLRRKWLLILAIVIFALTLGCVITERVIVTDREQIAEAIFDMAECVRTNDTEGIIQHVQPTKASFIDRIRNEMANYDFSVCHIMGFNEQTIEGNPHKSATFEFVVWAEGNQLRNPLSFKGNVRVTLEFEKHGDKWYVVGYDYVYPANSQQGRQMNY